MRTKNLKKGWHIMSDYFALVILKQEDAEAADVEPIIFHWRQLNFEYSQQG